MENKDIIEKVTEPSPWCYPIVIVDKKGTNEKRFTMDLKRLNSQVKRTVHPSKSPKEAVNNIRGAKFLTKIDATKGYWQVPLTKKSRQLTTFMTPWGRYRYKRNPMGYISAGNEFNLRMDQALDGIERLEKLVDDNLLYDYDYESHLQRVRQVLQRCREAGISLSLKKFEFAQNEVDFCGYKVSGSGWRVDNEKVDAIRKFPVPKNRTDLRSFFGLVQQFSDFSSKIAELGDLLKEKKRSYVKLIATQITRNLLKPFKMDFQVTNAC